MNQTPLKDFEQKFESFIRVWMRYFYHIEDFILAIEILIDRKQAMLQKDFLQKDQVDGKRDRQKVLEELYACYILDKREYIRLPDPIKQINANNQEILKDKDGKEIPQTQQSKPAIGSNGMPIREKETTEQKNQRADESIIWGFDLDNISKFKEYIMKMKDDCETQKKKNLNQIEANDTKVESDRETEERLLEENRRLTQFVDKSLKLLEDKLDSVLLAETKTDISKSMYHPDNYNLQLTQEKDDSHTFQIATEQLKCKQYARLYSFIQQNPIFGSEDDGNKNNNNNGQGDNEGQINANDSVAQPTSEQITQNVEKNKKKQKKN